MRMRHSAPARQRQAAPAWLPGARPPARGRSAAGMVPKQIESLLYLDYIPDSRGFKWILKQILAGFMRDSLRFTYESTEFT
jgi:hypothetical protein